MNLSYKRFLNNTMTIFVILSYLLTSAPHALAQIPEANKTENFSSDKNRLPPKITINISSEQDYEGVKSEITNNLKKQEHLTFISSDHPELLEHAIENRNKSQTQKNNLILIPYDDAAKDESQNKYLELLSQYKTHLVESAKNDKFGFLVISVSFGLDTFNWIHAGNLNGFSKAGNIIFSLLVTIAFGVNKEDWGRATKPIQEFYKKITFTTEKEFAKGSTGYWALRFVSSFSLASAIGLARMPLLPLNQMIDSTLMINAWSVPFLLAFVNTVSAFIWSEGNHRIDKDTQPYAKFYFRRILEIRNLVIGISASWYLLLNPSQYGPWPWIAIIGSGVTGLITYFNIDRLIVSIEQNKHLHVFAEKLGLKNKYKNPLTCEALFSY